MIPIYQKGSMLLWGTVTKNKGIKTGESKSGKQWRVCNFSIAYGEEDDPENAGSKKSKYMDCAAWGSFADYAERLEKGDKVLVAGQYKESEYNGDKTYTLVCEFIQAMEV